MSELILIVKAVTTSIVITMVVGQLREAIDRFWIVFNYLDDALDFNRVARGYFGVFIGNTFGGKSFNKKPT